MTYYINDSNGLRELPNSGKRLPVGCWFNPRPGRWSQLRMPTLFAARFGPLEWVDAPVDLLPAQMRVHMLLLGLS